MEQIRMAKFEIEIQKVLENEGGYTNHPDDRGGPTNHGIILSVLKSYRKNYRLTAEDVKALTVEEAKEIYKAKYWTPLNLDKIKGQRIAGVIFDQGVNCGIRTSAKRAQRIAKVVADGDIGPISQRALNKMDESYFVFEFFRASQHYYIDIVKRNPSQIVFLKGWINRSYGLLYS